MYMPEYIESRSANGLLRSLTVCLFMLEGRQQPQWLHLHSKNTL